MSSAREQERKRNVKKKKKSKLLEIWQNHVLKGSSLCISCKTEKNNA
jgi:hypothetical protein